MKLRELAQALGCELEGDGEVEIRGVAGLQDAREGDLTFVANPRYLKYAEQTQASAVILSPSHPSLSKPTLRTDNPYLAFARALEIFYPVTWPAPGVHPTAVLEEEVELGQEVSIGALAFVGRGARIGDRSILFPQVFVGAGSCVGRDSVLYPLVTVREGVRIGNRVIIHSGAVIGSDGFGYAKDHQGRYRKIPQLGGVIIEDEVEIGANVTIDRATLGDTRVGRGTKIDNLVQIAHNVQIGEDTIIISQVGIAGSTRVGNRVILAGQAGIVDHVQIGDDCIVGSQSGVAGDLEAGSMVLGSPAISQHLFKRMAVALPRVPEMLKSLRNLERRVQSLENARGGRP